MGRPGGTARSLRPPSMYSDSDQADRYAGVKKSRRSMAQSRSGSGNHASEDSRSGAGSDQPFAPRFGLRSGQRTQAHAVTGVELKGYCAGGFKDFTRIASSRPELWRDICLMNRHALGRSLGDYIKYLERLRRWIGTAKARCWKKSLPTPTRQGVKSRNGRNETHRTLKQPLHGEITVPGDKSIAHRAVILGSIAKGRSRIFNLSGGEDNSRTVRAFRQMGIEIFRDGDSLCVEGKGWDGLCAPEAPIDSGNSGTTMRLLSGLLAGRPFTVNWMAIHRCASVRCSGSSTR